MYGSNESVYKWFSRRMVFFISDRTESLPGPAPDFRFRNQNAVYLPTVHWKPLYRAARAQKTKKNPRFFSRNFIDFVIVGMGRQCFQTAPNRTERSRGRPSHSAFVEYHNKHVYYCAYSNASRRQRGMPGRPAVFPHPGFRKSVKNPHSSKRVRFDGKHSHSHRTVSPEKNRPKL